MAAQTGCSMRRLCTSSPPGVCVAAWWKSLPLTTWRKPPRKGLFAGEAYRPAGMAAVGSGAGRGDAQACPSEAVVPPPPTAAGAARAAWLPSIASAMPLMSLQGY